MLTWRSGERGESGRGCGGDEARGGVGEVKNSLVLLGFCGGSGENARAVARERDPPDGAHMRPYASSVTEGRARRPRRAAGVSVARDRDPHEGVKKYFWPSPEWGSVAPSRGLARVRGGRGGLGSRLTNTPLLHDFRGLFRP